MFDASKWRGRRDLVADRRHRRRDGGFLAVHARLVLDVEHDVADDGDADIDDRGGRDGGEHVALSRPDDPLVDRIIAQPVDEIVRSLRQRGLGRPPETAHRVGDAGAEIDAEPSQHGDESGADREGAGIGRVRVDPPAEEARDEPAREAQRLRDEAEGRREFRRAVGLMEQRKEGKVQRGRKRREIDDALAPDEVPDVFLCVGALVRVCRRLQRILTVVKDAPVLGDQREARRNADRSIHMRAGNAASQRALMDFRQVDLHLVVRRAGEAHVAQVAQLARAIAVVAAEAGARVIESAVLVPARLGVNEHVRVGVRRLLECEAAGLRLLHDPDEGNVGQRIVGIAAADVRVNAGKPYLAETFVADIVKSVAARLRQLKAASRTRARDGRWSARRRAPAHGMHA